ncbi:MAG: DUF3291 domain-containing protein [Candidatus Kapabacteria bacterium]|nr:DUF3291 domain-containing protein [Candidatus Kapabacteria bacterium]
MIVSITRIELLSYSKLKAFFAFNSKIIAELKQSKCKKHSVAGNWNARVWYTMTLWENEADLNAFYRNGTHLEAMKKSKSFSPHIQSTRIDRDEMLGWKGAKKLFTVP